MRSNATPTRLLLPLALACALPAGAAAQDADTSGTAARAEAPVQEAAAPVPEAAAPVPEVHALLERARAARSELGRSIVSYDAILSRRGRARLRLPLKDRLLGRGEDAARVHWSRDGQTVIVQLAGREEDASGVEPSSGFDTDALFDPAGDRVYFGMDMVDATGEDDDLWIAHPLAEGSEASYRYAIGDTMTVRLPDGRTIRAIELRVTPRRESFHYLSASLWIEPGSGAVVQAVFRPSRDLDLLRDTAVVDAEDRAVLERVPGMFKPLQADIGLVALEYSLWDMRHWLPHRMSVQGYVRAGVLRVPFEMETAYRILEVVDESEADGTSPPLPEEVLAAWGLATELVRDSTVGDSTGIALYRPADPALLLSSPELPPPMGTDAPGFATEDELDVLVERLERTMPRAGADTHLEFEWGLRGRELLRYNRVEGLSLGVRGRVTGGWGAGAAMLRLGSADLHPNARLSLSRPGRRVDIEAIARHELVAVMGGAPLGFGNSFGALVLGRDDGDYYRASGVRLELAPAAHERRWLSGALWAERQTAAERHTDWSLPHLFDGDHVFRPNLEADRADLYGATLTLAPWWGISALRPQAGLELVGAAATGDYTFARARLTARALLPLTDRLRIGAEAAAGTVWSDAPAQYAWFLGGPTTLRGYDGASAVGRDMLRARLEVTRGTGAAALALFGDAGWAGERAAFDGDDALVAAGVGLTLFDGLVRLDVAHALREPRGWRFDARVDAAF